MQESATAEDFLFEKAAAGNTAIAIEKPGPKDSDTLLEKDDVEKAKMAGDSALKQAITEMAVNVTQEKNSTEKAEIAAKENSTEMAVESTPQEDSKEKPELATDQEDFDLVINEDPKKVYLDSGT